MLVASHYCSDVIEHLVGKDVYCLLLKHCCFVQSCCSDDIEHYVRHLLLIACLLYSIIGIDDSMPSHDQDVICHVMGGFLFISYFIFSSGRLNRMLSQMCGRLYFPIFLLSVGLFTLMYIDSLMVLATVLSSLPSILKLSIDHFMATDTLMLEYW